MTGLNPTLPRQTTFHGTSQEATDLVTAIGHYCECEADLLGMRTSTCGLHQALLYNQAWLDRLLFARRLAARWHAQEFGS